MAEPLAQNLDRGGLSAFDRGAICAVAASLFSSVAWVFEKEAVMILGPLETAASATVIAALLLFAFLLARRKPPRISELWSVRREIAVRVLIQGVIGGVLIAYAVQLTSSAKVMFLTKIEPYLVILWQWIFFRETVRSYHLFLLAVHVVGAVLLSTGGDLRFQVDQLGDLLLLLGVLLHSATYGVSRRIADRCGSVAATGVTQLLTGVILFPIAWVVGDFSAAITADSAARGRLCLIAAVGCYYILGTVLWFYALRFTRAWLVSALRCVGPLLAAPVAVYFFDQRLTSMQLAGGAIVLLTSVLMVKDRRI